jgi:F0F1-type ATP synthase membrane subunit b/b'
MKQPSTEDLTRLREQLREEISEARGTLKDLRHEIKAARELVASAKDLATTLADDTVRAAIEAEVTKQIETLGKVTKEQMDKSCAKVISEFDKFRDLLLGHERAADGREQRSIPDLLQDPAVLAGVQRRLREAGRG